jgi:hypothetical protein
MHCRGEPDNLHNTFDLFPLPRPSGQHSYYSFALHRDESRDLSVDVKEQVLWCVYATSCSIVRSIVGQANQVYGDGSLPLVSRRRPTLTDSSGDASSPSTGSRDVCRAVNVDNAKQDDRLCC